MGKINSRKVWVLVELPLKDCTFAFYQTTEYELDNDPYNQTIMDDLKNVHVFYDPRELQRVINGLESIGIEVREVNYE